MWCMSLGMCSGYLCFSLWQKKQITLIFVSRYDLSENLILLLTEILNIYLLWISVGCKTASIMLLLSKENCRKWIEDDAFWISSHTSVWGFSSATYVYGDPSR